MTVIEKTTDKSMNRHSRRAVNRKITDGHRAVVTRYYGRLLRRYGLDALLRRIPSLKRIVWTVEGLTAVEARGEGR